MDCGQMCFHAMKGITENCELNMQGNAWGQILPESLKSWQIQPFPFSQILIFFYLMTIGKKKVETSDLKKSTAFWYIPLTWNINTPLHWATETVLDHPPQHLKCFACLFFFSFLPSNILIFSVSGKSNFEGKGSEFCYISMFH